MIHGSWRDPEGKISTPPRSLQNTVIVLRSPTSNMSFTNGITEAFAPITLAEMSEVALMDRRDTKYLFHYDRLPALLEAILPHYRLLEVDGVRGTTYRSLYFDTTDLRLYRDHHNGRSFRKKVRFRQYCGTGLCFLEVKRKNGRGDTRKERVKVEAIPVGLDSEHCRFVGASIKDPAGLQPVLWNTYERLTFVAIGRPERLTIDTALHFACDGLGSSLEHLCIAELKQERSDRSSPCALLMQRMHIRPGGLSKYCTGMTLLHPELKHNAFNHALRSLGRTGTPATTPAPWTPPSSE